MAIDDVEKNQPLRTEEEENIAVAGFSNCCNGKVGVGAIMAAQNDPSLRDLVLPTGVRLVSPSGTAEVSNSTNCCNGRVGTGSTQ